MDTGMGKIKPSPLLRTLFSRTNIPMHIHEKICLLRKVKGWTQEEMAEKLQMSLHGYANIERGDTDVQLSRIEQISQVFGIELKDLINFDGKSVLNNIASDECNFTNCFNSSNKNLEHELEKCQLIIEQQAKEIGYLKEMIELLKVGNAT
jgi:transcriptional regulator with XRE-family HTH domain